jgi:dimethylargininase
MSFRCAIVRPPGRNFADGLTAANLGIPDFDRALAQHAAYCEALERCGLTLIRLPEDPRHPDSTFVEDTAVLTPRRAILTRPGAPSRAGEVAPMGAVLSRFYSDSAVISDPGTLDGGDVCEVEGHFLIGVSTRTNEEGARQLAAILAEGSLTSAVVDIRTIEGILHLKAAVAYVGDGRIVAIDALAQHPAFRSYEIIRVEPMEAYAANCVRVNDKVLIAAGFPRLEVALRRAGCEVFPLEMSEFQKMDGGLSCLSLRF